MPFLSRAQLLIGTIVVTALLLAYFQTANFPFVPFTDAICFLPQAVKFAQGDGLRNVYQFAYLPGGEYVWHGFLFPLVLGGLFKTDTYVKVSEAMGILNALNVLLLSVALVRLTLGWRLTPRLLFLTACLLAQIGFLQGVLGRPENLASLLLSLGLLLWTIKPNTTVYFAIGAVVGMLAVTSPAPALCSAAFLLVALLVREPRPLALMKTCIVIGVGAVIAIAVSFAFYPYTLSQWIWGLEQHSKSVLKRGYEWLNISELLRQYVISSGRLMMGGVFLAALMAAVYLVWRKATLSFGMRVAAVVLLCSIGALAVRFSIVSGFYVMLSLFPLGAGVFTVLFSLEGSSGVFRLFLLKPCIALSLAIAALDPLLLQGGRALGFSGMSFQEARQFFARDMAEMPGKVAVSMDLAVLSDSADRLQTLYKFVPPCKEPDTDWLVAQQHTFFYDAPPSYENFTLVKNRFKDVRKLPGRLFQWFGVNGYGYAIYQRSERTR